ncbi:MAG TPA: hypothetical protein EYP17_09865 [Candidatus Latescibacteria bacterium]|nr:hypothetical protein [Candidatus Latescibacterota bacterium]
MEANRRTPRVEAWERERAVGRAATASPLPPSLWVWAVRVVLEARKEAANPPAALLAEGAQASVVLVSWPPCPAASELEVAF